MNKLAKLRKEGAKIDLVAVSEVYKNQEDKVCTFIKEETGTDPKRYIDYTDLLADKDVDAVCIGTPDHWHHRQIVDSLKAGKHVYAEKPMTKTVEEALDVVKLWRETGLVMQVGVQSTSLKVWDQARELIEAGKLGKVLGFQTEFFRNSSVGQWRYYKLDPAMSPATIDWEAVAGRGRRPRPHDGLRPGPLRPVAVLLAVWLGHVHRPLRAPHHRHAQGHRPAFSRPASSGRAASTSSSTAARCPTWPRWWPTTRKAARG